MSQFVAVRLSDETIAEMDEAIRKFGGNRSDFIRRAIEQRLGQLQTLAQGMAPTSATLMVN